jgi:hypothetical protein
MKLIRFFAKDNDIANLGNQPVPMKKLVPEWYRKAESYWEISDSHGHTMGGEGLKKCMPYMDTMVSGYAVLTPYDIFVKKKEDGTLDITWNAPDNITEFVQERPMELGSTMPRPAGHHPNHLIWSGVWGFKTPRKYSALLTHPLNRFDLPFTTTSGIIDSDKWHASGNVPFFLKEDFVGTIPAGTPIFQIVPIKRASWKMIQNDTGLQYTDAHHGFLARQKETSYKKIMWERKEFN